MLKNAVLVAYGRSPVCRSKKGALAEVHPVDYAAEVLNGVLKQVPQLNVGDIADVVVGCAMPVKRANLNVARLIVQRAGLPNSVCAQTVNRFCASGLQALASCAAAIACGQEEIMVAGGVEDMSGTFKSADPGDRNAWLVEHVAGAYISMGETAEKVARRYNIPRVNMEELAVASHQKAAAAQDAGYLAKSIIPVTGKDAEGNRVMVDADEGIRRTSTMEKLASLEPCFDPEHGVVTAATSSQTSDAAAFAVLMSEAKAAELGLKPLARLRSYATGGCDGTVMGLGPIYAVPKALHKAGMTLADMDVIELNEAFAVQALACINDLKLPVDKLNPWGGAMALGHPMGATGLFLTIKALDYLQINNGKHALVTMCIGGGMGAAAVFERL